METSGPPTVTQTFVSNSPPPNKISVKSFYTIPKVSMNFWPKFDIIIMLHMCSIKRHKIIIVKAVELLNIQDKLLFKVPWFCPGYRRVTEGTDIKMAPKARLAAKRHEKTYSCYILVKMKMRKKKLKWQQSCDNSCLCVFLCYLMSLSNTLDCVFFCN